MTTTFMVAWRQLPAAVLEAPCPLAQLNTASTRGMAHPSYLDALQEYLHQSPENKSRPSWIIIKSAIGGRGLFATKPIKRGTLIFDNKPLVIGPRANAAGIYCSKCYITSDVCYKCHKCSLLICSEECETSPEHCKDCAFITQNWKLKESSDDFPKLLIYLRLLLLTEEQMLLVSFLQKSISQPNVEELETLCSKYSIPDEHQRLMKTMSSVLKINSFRISNYASEKKIPLRGLYPLSAFLNHACVPNTRNIFNKDYSMTVFATRDIEVGEELFSCYTGLLWCTPARRCQLYKTKSFWCKCDRCKDATEMGTKLSALKCLNKDCMGILLPVSPLDPITAWCCDNCGAVEAPGRVTTVQSVLGSLVGTLDLDDHLRLETFIFERLATFIPYSSHIFVDLRLRLALKLGFAAELKLKELSESRLSLKERLCRSAVRTVAALGAGDAHLRGLLLYHLHAALAERARRATHLYEELKSEIESTIEQAYNILQGDISAPPDLELRRRYLGPGSDKPQEEKFFILDS